MTIEKETMPAMGGELCEQKALVKALEERWFLVTGRFRQTGRFAGLILGCDLDTGVLPPPEAQDLA